MGEFIQCLKILQYNPEDDPTLVPIVNSGIDYLLYINAKVKVDGMWTSHSCEYEKMKHTTYCATMGLLDYYYCLDEGRRYSPPSPAILQKSWWDPDKFTKLISLNSK